MAVAKRKASVKPKSKMKVKKKAKVVTKSKKKVAMKKRPAAKKMKVVKKKAVKKKAVKKTLANKKVAKKKVAKKKVVKAKSAKRKGAKKPAKLKKVKQGKTKAKSEFDFSTEQKQDFLNTMTKIIDIHRSDVDGLKSLTRIERILDQYNQQFKDAHGKFDAIVHYGMEEDPALKIAHVYIPVHHKEKEVTDIYRLLADIGNGKSNFDDAKEELENIYDQSVNARRS